MKDLLKNPIAQIIVLVFAVWVALKVLHVVLNSFVLLLAVVIVMYFVSPRFRGIVQGLFSMFTKK